LALSHGLAGIKFTKLTKFGWLRARLSQAKPADFKKFIKFHFALRPRLRVLVSLTLAGPWPQAKAEPELTLQLVKSTKFVKRGSLGPALSHTTPAELIIVCKF
jgi:hypothetical protein